mgnify:CR=1 FL=1
MKLSNLVTYKKNNFILFLSLVFIILSFSIYSLYFDILVPEIPLGSYRKNVGDYFLIPVFLLTSFQILFNSSIIHVIIKVVSPKKRDFLKALFISSILVSLFSIFYLIFPFYGPFLYIVRFVSGFDFSAYLVLIAWTLFNIFLISSLLRKIYSIEKTLSWKKTLLIIALLFGITMTIAS